MTMRERGPFRRAKGVNMSNFDQLRDLINETAGNLAQAEPDPAKWAQWVLFLCECLEAEAFDNSQGPDYPKISGPLELAFERIREGLSSRLERGRWSDAPALD
jgi:hypothetical protein